MNFTDTIIDYKKNFKIKERGVIDSVSYAILSDQLTTYNEERDFKIKERYTTVYRNLLNTSLLPDTLCKRLYNPQINIPEYSTILPETAMLFLKTYLFQLFKQDVNFKTCFFNENLVKVFNKNSELIEIPHALALYLGGLHYFNDVVNIPQVSKTDDVFLNINGITYTKDTSPFKRDLYDPYNLNKDSEGDYLLNKGFINNTNKEAIPIFHNYPNSSNLPSVINKIYPNPELSYKSMPYAGYGIQNNFLTKYNKYLFDDELGTNYPNDNAIIAGAHKGMIKPIKTYQSGVEFTAFYRTPYLGDLNIPFNNTDFSPKSFLSELTKIVNLLKIDIDFTTSTTGNYSVKKGRETIVLDFVHKMFLLYSKLKVAFITNKITNNDLTTFFNEVIPNNNPQYLLSFLLALRNLFFCSFSSSDFFNHVGSTVDSKLDFNFNVNEVLPPKLPLLKLTLREDYFEDVSEEHKLMYYNKQTNTIVDSHYLVNSLSVFLKSLWSEEAKNGTTKTKKFSTLNTKAVHVLLPSAGGFVAPHVLFKYLNSPGHFGSRPSPSVKDDKALKDPNHLTVVAKKIRLVSSSDYQKNYHFDNSAILKNSTRFLWFDDTIHGSMLMNDFLNTNYFDAESGTLGYETSDDIFQSDLLENSNEFEYRSAAAVNIDFFDQYNISNLMDSLDFQKLDRFKDLFLDFCKTNPASSDKFTLKTLILASTTIPYDEIHGTDLINITIKDEIDKILPFTLNEINLLLIGNHMYNYDFMAESQLAQILNISLTFSQKIKCDNVVDKFCSDKITIANFSPIGSLEYNSGGLTISAPKIMLHNFITSPDLLFNNTDSLLDTETLISSYGTNKTDVYRYLVRKILFSDQYVAPYVASTSFEKNILGLLNKKYLSNYNITINFNNGNFLEYYNAFVIEFFKYLNIELNEPNYKLLFKMIRSYVAFSMTKHEMVTYEDIMKYKKTDLNTLIGLSNFSHTFTSSTSFADDFFYEFINNTISGVESLDVFLVKIADLMVPDQQSGNNVDPQSNNTENDLKMTTYYNIKNIFDKICGFTKTQTSTSDLKDVQSLSKLSLENLNNIKLFYNEQFNSSECVFEDSNQSIPTDNYDLYEIFQVVDRGTNNIGTKVLGNLTYLYENLYTEFIIGDESVANLTAGSFVKLFSGLAKESGFLFQQIPKYLNLNSAIGDLGSTDDGINEVVDQLFGVHTNTGLFGDLGNTPNKTKSTFGGLNGFPGYIFQLGTISSTIDSVSSDTTNNLTNSFCLDIGKDKNNQINVLSNDNTPEDIHSANVTCFVVDFGTKNQQMFKTIDLDTAEFYDTEESIKTWVNLNNEKSNIGHTKNLFPILDKRSYTCTITTLGNATIQPLTYFYLRNTPLFSGTYWITNVTHKIIPNDMITTFKGVRQPIVIKSDSRSELIKLIKKRSAEILSTKVGAGIIVTEGIPETSGMDIKKVSGEPYSTILQKKSSAEGYYPFNGQDVIGCYIFSLTGSNESEANKALIGYLYNLSQAFSGSNTHSEIIANMVNIAIGDMHSYDVTEKRYFTDSKDFSLSVLFKTGALGYSHNGVLCSILNKLVLDRSVINNLNFTSTVKLFDLIATNQNGEPIENKSERITFRNNNSTSTNITSLNLGFTNAFLDLKTTNNSKENAFISTELIITYFDLFNAFDPTSTTIPISRIGTEITVDPTYGVKYYGTLDNIALFSFAVNGKFDGKCKMSDKNKNIYNIIAGNSGDVITISQTIDGTSTASNPSTTKVQMDVKTYLKNKGVSPIIAAGIMGNMQMESSFKLRNLSPEEKSGGKTTVNDGLIQWNSKYYDLSKIGETVQAQMDFLFKSTDRFKEFLKEATTAEGEGKGADHTAWLFAHIVEFCQFCDKDYETYVKGGDYLYPNKKIVTLKPIKRSEYAVDFYKRFMNPTDHLYWT